MNDGHTSAADGGSPDMIAESEQSDIIALLADERLAQTLHSMTRRAGMRFVRSDTAIDLIACNAAAHVVDLAACRPEDWAAVRQYLQEVAVDGPGDDTPLFLVNYTSASHTDLCLALAKPEGSVQRFTQTGNVVVAFGEWLRHARKAREAATDTAVGRKPR